MTKSGVSSSVKIDILAPAINQTEVPSTTDKNSKLSNYQSLSKCSSLKLSTIDELSVISREIDKQMTKKTIETVELLKELLSGCLERNVFLAKMSDASETTLSDIILIAKKLIKRHKFEPNPNYKEFTRIKFLHFPTTSRDLGKHEKMFHVIAFKAHCKAFNDSTSVALKAFAPSFVYCFTRALNLWRTLKLLSLHSSTFISSQ